MSIVVAGIMGFQSLAIGQVAPEVRRIDPMTVIAEAEKTVKGSKRGLGLSDAKKMLEAVLEVNSTAKGLVVQTMAMKKDIVDPMKLVIAEKLEHFQNLKTVMETNRAALSVLINNPIENPYVRYLYFGVLLTNAIPAFMASNDQKGTPILFKNNPQHRETMRAWMTALPLIGAAIIRAMDPTAAVNIDKIHADIDLEMTKLQSLPGSTGDFQKQISEITRITGDQVRIAGQNYSQLEEGLKTLVVGHGSNVSVGNAIMLGSVLYAVLQAFGGKWAIMADQGKAVIEVLAKNKDTLVKSYDKVSTTTRQAGQYLKTLPDALKTSMGSAKGMGRSSKAHYLTDGAGVMMTLTDDKGVKIAKGIVEDYRGAIADIQITIEQLQAALKK